MSDKPRYSRIPDILDLATYMQLKPLGVTLNYIAICKQKATQYGQCHNIK